MKKYVIELGHSSKFEPDFLFHQGGGKIAWSQSTRKSRDDTRTVEQRIKDAQEHATHYNTKKIAEKEVKELFGEMFQYRISKVL